MEANRRIRFWLSFAMMSIVALNARAEKYAFLFGGSGEEENPDNFFIPDYVNLKTSLEARGYKVVVLYDKHPEEVGAQGMATVKGVDEQLADYEKKLKKGDQVMYIAHAHGADPRELPMPVGRDRGLKGHGIGLDDDAYDSARMVHSAKRLQKSGVRSAIMDLSCYSGNTQPDDPEGICAITLAAKSYISVCAASGTTHSFTQGLIAAFQNPTLKNLEEAFLFSRERDETPVNLPQISSFKYPFEPVFDSLLDQGDPTSKDDLARLERAGQTGKCETVTSDPALLKLGQLTRNWDRGRANALESAVAEIFALRNSANRAIEGFYQTQAGDLTINPPDGQPLVDVKYEAILRKMNLVQLQGFLGTLTDLRDPSQVDALQWARPEDKALLKAMLPNRRQIGAKIYERLNRDPLVRSYQSDRAQLEIKTKALLQLGRKLYKAEFETVSRKQKTKGKNPCNDYKL